jgi:hypothetical protein
MMMSTGGSQSSMSSDPETTAPEEAGGDAIPSGAIAPEVIFEALGFESAEEFVQWLSSLDFETMKSMLESLFGK